MFVIHGIVSSLVQIGLVAHEKVASDLGLGGGLPRDYSAFLHHEQLARQNLPFVLQKIFPQTKFHIPNQLD